MMCLSCCAELTTTDQICRICGYHPKSGYHSLTIEDLDNECKNILETFKKPNAAKWPHKYFEWELNGERICQPFINISCVRIIDDSFWVVAKYGANNSDLLVQKDVPGQLEAYLAWVDFKS